MRMTIDVSIIYDSVLGVFFTESAHAEYISDPSNRPSFESNAVWPGFKNVKGD